MCGSRRFLSFKLIHPIYIKVATILNKLTATTTGITTTLFSPLYGTNWAAKKDKCIIN